MKVFIKLIFLAFILCINSHALTVGETKNFDYTGGLQTYTIPEDGYYFLEVWGSQGGMNLNDNQTVSNGGKGGYASGYKFLTKGTTLYIAVGGQGGTPIKEKVTSGGYNGGGDAEWDHHDDDVSGAGGGATHIAISKQGDGQLFNYETHKDDVLLVAGGGGGSYWTFPGGAGGGDGSWDYTLKNPLYVPTVTGSDSASQIGGYAFGRGENGKQIAFNSPGAGAGGGWYGGYAGSCTADTELCSAQGGSGYIGGVESGNMLYGVQTGPGKASITFVSSSTNAWFYSYTGSVQEFTAPVSGYYSLEVWGASGGANMGDGHFMNCAGTGGYSSGTKYLKQGETLYIAVGGKGENGSFDKTVVSGGWNGGGTGARDNGTEGGYVNEYAGGGGGATHIAIGTNRGELKNYNTNRDKILIVAGGGGGSAFCNNTTRFSDGGGLIAQSAQHNSSANPGQYATQITGNAFGQGTNGVVQPGSNNYPSDGVPGGGGGWYGSKTTIAEPVIVSGGSSYIGGVDNGYTKTGGNIGNGHAIIKLVEESEFYQGKCIRDSATKTWVEDTDVISQDLTYETADNIMKFIPYSADRYVCETIKPVKVVDQPESRVYIYDGYSGEGYYSTEAYTVSGTTSSSNIGNYQLTATLKDGYVWSDNTTNPKNVSWSVAKGFENDYGESGWNGTCGSTPVPESEYLWPANYNFGSGVTFYAEIEGVVGDDDAYVGNWESAGGGIYGNTGELCTEIFVNGDTWYQEICTRNINDGGTNYVSGVYNGSELKLYVNGKLENSMALSGTVKVSSMPVTIGNPGPSDGKIYATCNNAKVIKAAVFDTALTLDEINGLKSNKTASDVSSRKYSISYELEGGTLTGSYPTTYTAGYKTQLPTPTKEGYEFVGWIDETKEYNELNYIYNTTGYEQINTGLQLPNGFSVEAGIALEDRPGVSTFGVDIAGAHNVDEDTPIPEYGRNHIFVYNNNHYASASVKDFSFGIDCNGELNYPTNGLIVPGQYYKFEGSTVIGNAYMKVDGVSYPVKNQNTKPMSSDYIYIFRNTYAVAKETNVPSVLMKLYYEEIKDNAGSIVRNYVPVYNSQTDKAGLLDTISNTFYGMTGNGEIGYDLKYPNVIPANEMGNKTYKAVWKKSMVVNTANVSGDFSQEGNLVTIDGAQYKVLSVDGTRVELTAYNRSSTWIPIKDIDTYLNDTFYNSLSNEVKNAIVPVDIYSNTYSWSRSADSNATINQTQTLDGTVFSLNKVGSEKYIGVKNIFLLDVQDIVTKYGNSPTGEQIKWLFADESDTNRKVLWTRSLIYAGSEYGEDGPNRFGYMSWERSVRGNLSDGDDYVKPVFILDLSLLNY